MQCHRRASLGVEAALKKRRSRRSVDVGEVASVGRKIAVEESEHHRLNYGGEETFFQSS